MKGLCLQPAQQACLLLCGNEKCSVGKWVNIASGRSYHGVHLLPKCQHFIKEVNLCWTIPQTGEDGDLGS